MDQKISGLIVAAGRGVRAGGGIPKQYRMIAGKTVLRRAAEALLAHPDISNLQIVIHPDDSDLYTDATKDLPVLPVVWGGKTRSDSVLLGLKALEKSSPDTVLIHDAARSNLPIEVIDNVLNALQSSQGAVPCLAVIDALWRGGRHVKTPESRQNLWRAQTPQGFDFKTILNAHQTATRPADDDVALARQTGIKVTIVEGSERNFKITTPADFARAEKELKHMDIRTGNGFDVHAFGVGEFVTLCGIQIPHSHGLSGHSDADVAMHAVTDAIFGALCEGDIGQWFPPSEAKWKGADSAIFLKKAVQRADEREFAITHIDCTIICETPKIGPHATVMRAKMAEIAGLTIDRISVKATTSEKLGFTGRNEGIAAMATATLVKS